VNPTIPAEENSSKNNQQTIILFEIIGGQHGEINIL
jgi:hypothetical protein